MKKIIFHIIAFSLMFGMVIPTMATEIVPTTSNVIVNQKNVQFEAYNIDGNNYLKLRDLAYILNGTNKQFDVNYEVALDVIILTSGKSYTIVGGEMDKKATEISEVIETNTKVIMDGVEIEMQAYNINGNNYFKLRDLGQKIDFGVEYSEATNSVTVDTNKKYNGIAFEQDNRPRDEDGYLIPETSPLFTPAPPLKVPAPSK